MLQRKKAKTDSIEINVIVGEREQSVLANEEPEAVGQQPEESDRQILLPWGNRFRN